MKSYAEAKKAQNEILKKKCEIDNNYAKTNQEYVMTVQNDLTKIEESIIKLKKKTEEEKKKAEEEKKRIEEEKKRLEEEKKKFDKDSGLTDVIKYIATTEIDNIALSRITPNPGYTNEEISKLYNAIAILKADTLDENMNLQYTMFKTFKISNSNADDDEAFNEIIKILGDHSWLGTPLKDLDHIKSRISSRNRLLDTIRSFKHFSGSVNPGIEQYFNELWAETCQNKNKARERFKGWAHAAENLDNEMEYYQWKYKEIIKSLSVPSRAFTEYESFMKSYKSCKKAQKKALLKISETDKGAAEKIEKYMPHLENKLKNADESINKIDTEKEENKEKAKKEEEEEEKKAKDKKEEPKEEEKKEPEKKPEKHKEEEKKTEEEEPKEEKKEPEKKPDTQPNKKKPCCCTCCGQNSYKHRK